VHKGDQFAVTLTVEGVYDYYCMPHMEAWKEVPMAAQKAFPNAAIIMKQRIVRHGYSLRRS